MSEHDQQHKQEEVSVEAVIAEARRRLNRGQLRQCLLGSAFACGVAASLSAMGFIFAGHGVPLWIYPATLAAILTATALWYWRAAYRHDDAARHLDRHFDLKDAVIAHLTFARSGRSNGFFALQHRWTRQHLRGLDLAGISSPASRRQLAATAVVAIALLCMAFAPISPQVLARQQQERHTHQLSEELKLALKEHVDQMIREADEQEQALIEPNELRQLVDELKQTADLEDMLRQYAKMEQQVAEASSKLNQRDAERLLADAGRRLAQSAESAQLGQQLQQKAYADAARELEKLRPDAKAKLQEQRENLSRLKKSAAQMAEAASAFRSGGGQSGDGDNESSAQRLARGMEQLNRDVQQYEKKLSECESQQKRDGQCDAKQLEQLGQTCGSCNGGLGDLQKQLRQLGAARSAQTKLDQLRKMLSQCQGHAAGLCQNPFGNGGKNAGEGSSRMVNQEKTPEGGQSAALQGIKGAGPSQVSVEQASSGDAVRSGRQQERERGFQRQFESFVQREDVPEAVKGGVKTYFQTIHPEVGSNP